MWPNMPQKAAGMRILPPMSPPTSRGVNRAATAAEPPPEEPPGLLSRSKGLFVWPYTSLKLYVADGR